MITINRYAYGNAAEHVGCQNGPDVLKNALENSPLSHAIHWTPRIATITDQRRREALGDVVSLNLALAQHTFSAVKNKALFITLGGDHSAAIGSWSGATSAAAPQALGLIWIDAHMDANTPETSPSQNIHGMPLATLLGFGHPALTQLYRNEAKLNPQQVVLIGTRSYESGEENLLKKLGVTIYDMHCIEKNGLKNVIADAIAIATKNTVGFGVSIDLDAFDPTDAPGTGTPEKEGIPAAAFLQLFPMIAQHPKLVGADIVEFDPSRDKKDQTKNIALSLIKALVR